MTIRNIKAAANQHAMEQLGKEQFKSNKDAVKAIVDDFKAGALWHKQQGLNDKEQGSK